MTTREMPTGRPVAPAQLEELGKQAATLSDVSGLSLTEAVVRTLGPEKLSAEQVRRVVEHCNVTAVQRKYAAMTGHARIAHFDEGPADPEQVLRAVKTAAAPAALPVHALEYTVAPGHRTATKVASRTNVVVPAPDLMGLRRKLAAAHEELSAEADAAEFRMEAEMETLKLAAQQAMRDGAQLAELYAAWAQRDARGAKVAAAQLRATIPWGTKLAGRHIAPSHRVVQIFEGFAKQASRYFDAVEGRREVEAELGRVDARLRRMAS